MMQVAEFYKSWDLYGALSNFSAHSISMPSEAVSLSGALPSAPSRQWPSVEHFYQAQKFAGQFLGVLGIAGCGNESVVILLLAESPKRSEAQCSSQQGRYQGRNLASVRCASHVAHVQGHDIWRHAQLLVSSRQLYIS